MPASEQTEKQSNWAVHFPGNLRWSNAMQIVKGMAPYGAIAMDEVDRIGRRLTARATEADLDRVWREELSAMADRLADVADRAARKGARSPPATTSCVPATTTTAPSASFRPDGEARDVSPRRCAPIRPSWALPAPDMSERGRLALVSTSNRRSECRGTARHRGLIAAQRLVIHRELLRSAE